MTAAAKGPASAFDRSPPAPSLCDREDRPSALTGGEAPRP